MQTKLTISIDKEVIEEAKKFAKNQGRSLSNLIENYLKYVVQKKGQGKISPGIRKLKGSVKVPPDFNYKEVLTDELMKKYQK